MIKTLGSSTISEEIERLRHEALHEIKALQGQMGLFVSEQDAALAAFLGNLSNAQVSVAGPELVLGAIFDKIGFGQVVGEEMFRHLVISRLVYPGSKLKMIDYLQRYQGLSLSVDSVYRFLDKLNEQYKEVVEGKAFEHTKMLLGGHVGVVFYDMTTLYFEASDEDDLRKTGFSKDGRAQNPQILLGLLVGGQGYPIGYEIDAKRLIISKKPSESLKPTCKSGQFITGCGAVSRPTSASALQPIPSTRNWKDLCMPQKHHSLYSEPLI